MQGPNNNPGLIQRVLEYIMDSPSASSSNATNGEKQSRVETKWKFSVSYMEIYNENVYDLLVDPSKDEKKTSLTIQEEKNKTFSVKDLSWHDVSNAKDALALMEEGVKHRTVRETKMNAVSSRSHSVFSLHSECVVTEFEWRQVISPSGEPQNVEVQGKAVKKSSLLNLVDLAGSEKVKQAQTGKLSKCEDVSFFHCFDGISWLIICSVVHHVLLLSVVCLLASFLQMVKKTPCVRLLKSTDPSPPSVMLSTSWSRRNHTSVIVTTS